MLDVCKDIHRLDVRLHRRDAATLDSRLMARLDDRPDRVDWREVLLALDSVGAESIQMPANPKLGFDGWAIAVEVGSQAGYRAHTFLGARIYIDRCR